MTAKKAVVRRKRNREIPAAPVKSSKTPAFLSESEKIRAKGEFGSADTISREFERDSWRYPADLEVDAW